MIHVIHAHAPTYVKYREAWVGERRKGGQGKKGAREIMCPMDMGHAMSSLAVLTPSLFFSSFPCDREGILLDKRLDWDGQ